MNSAELRTKGYELSVSWRDQFKLAGKPFEYSVGFNISDYKSVITKYDNNPNKSLTNLTKGDYYVGMEIGEIWGFKTDGFFKTTEEAQAYAKEVDLSYSTGRLTGGWQAGDLKFVDLDGNGVWGVGNDTVDKPGDRTILGNSLPTLSYGINASIRWMGFDASVFFQGTGNHYWYPHGEMMPFWGCYSYPYLSYLPTDFLGKVWAEDNPNSYFPRARAYSSSGGYLSKVNDRYLQNIRYLRLKNLTVGYTIPATLTKKAGHRPDPHLFLGREPLLLVAAQKELQVRRSRSGYQPFRREQQRLLSVGQDVHVRHRHHLLIISKSEYHEAINHTGSNADCRIIGLRLPAGQRTVGSGDAVRLLQDEKRPGTLLQSLLRQPAGQDALR